MNFRSLAKLIFLGQAALFLMEAPAWAARETPKEKEAATRRFRTYVQLIGRLPLNRPESAQGTAGRPVVDGAQLETLHKSLAPRLVSPSERRKFDAAFAALEKEVGTANREAAVAATTAYLDLVYAWFKVFLSPAQTPDALIGREIYQSQCATCHGATGGGDGKLAASPVFKTQAPPTRLNEAAFGLRMSPFLVYNTLMIGMPGTVMPAYVDGLTDHEIWSVSFYVAALPQGGAVTDPVAQWQKESAAAKQACLGNAGSLAELSRLTDRQLAERFLRPASKPVCSLVRLRILMPFIPSLPRS